MNPVEEYIFRQTENKRDILLYFHEIFTERFHLKPKIRFRIPMYYGNRWLVYLNADNRKGVEVSFLSGHLLSQEHKLVISKGRKLVKSVEFTSLEEVPEEELMAIINEAVEIDKKLPKK